MSKKKNSDNRAELMIEFDEVTTQQDGLAIFRPLDTISGSMRLTPRRDLTKVRDTTIELRWYTTGRGDTNKGVIESRVIRQGPLSKDMDISETFRFDLPKQPWSFSGHYVTINWAIWVKVDIQMASDITLFQNFLMLPGDGSSDGGSVW